MENTDYQSGGRYPVLVLREDLLLPGTTMPVEITRPATIAAVDNAIARETEIVVVPQLDSEVEKPGPDDLLEIGVLAEIIQTVKYPGPKYTVVLRGIDRVQLDEYVESSPSLTAQVSPFISVSTVSEELRILMARVKHILADVIASDMPDARQHVLEITDADEVVQLAMTHVELDRDLGLALLADANPLTRLQRLLPHVLRLRKVLAASAEIQNELETPELTREQVLRARLRQIQEELGESDRSSEYDELADKIAASGMSEQARTAARREARRLTHMDPSSPQYSLAKTYVDTLLELPWGIFTKDTLDVAAARAILDADHAGLEKTKKRILEFVATRKLAPGKAGPIICFVGPPGVGKTSLGRSIASALGRKYVRIALGGVRDESAIRGHRRTYVGALPGRVASALKEAGSMNPVMVLDEIDKLGSSNRGDPTSAMLEVLDPQQNAEFMDHYADVPLDLSQVMFIATANQLGTIPAPLLDRLEIVPIAGYTQHEKLEIAQRHLVPKQIVEHGLSRGQLEISADAIREIINFYTREGGVRNLERELAAVCRSAAVKIVGGEHGNYAIDREHIDDILGPRRFESELAGHSPTVGVATGLAWTPVGGEVLFIEARSMPGTGQLKLTGNMGDVMLESANAALSYVRSKGIGSGTQWVFNDRDIHIHLPSGAVPKDGPSAGAAITTALMSLLTRKPIRNDVAMTGEISLRGLVLPVGGIKEKVIAAHRAGAKLVLLPVRNGKDLHDIPQTVKDELDIRLVTRIDEVFEIALLEGESSDAQDAQSSADAPVSVDNAAVASSNDLPIAGCD